jgi:large subunit ribosomal protein L30
MEKIKIKQVKSGIDRPERQKRTLKALGFSKLNQVIEVTKSPAVEGMIKKISHLVTILE